MLTAVALSGLPTGGLAPLRGSALFSSTFAPVPIVMIVVALFLYFWGVRRFNLANPRHLWPAHRTGAFIGGLASTAVAIFSFIGVYDGELFWDHMVQHLLLIMVAAPLFAMSSPLCLLWRSSTGETHRLVTRVLRSKPSQILGHPVVAFCAYAVVIPLTHLTSWYNYTLEHETVHNAEHLVFLGVGYLFWRQVFGADPNRFRLHHGMRFLYLFMAIPVDTFTGLSLTGATHELFPAYLHLVRNWGPSRVTDLHMGGAIMWAGGDTLMLWPMIPVSLGWMHIEERRGIRADQEADRALEEARQVESLEHRRLSANGAAGNAR